MVRVFSMIMLGAALALSGCSTVDYGDAQGRETVNTDFGSTDLQMISARWWMTCWCSRPLCR